MNLENLTEEQIAKAKACSDKDELLAFIKNEGIELTDEQLEGVAGGSWTDDTVIQPLECGVCHTITNTPKTAIDQWHRENGAGYAYTFVCPRCGETTQFLNL